MSRCLSGDRKANSGLKMFAMNMTRERRRDADNKSTAQAHSDALQRKLKREAEKEQAKKLASQSYFDIGENEKKGSHKSHGSKHSNNNNNKSTLGPTEAKENNKATLAEKMKNKKLNEPKPAGSKAKSSPAPKRK